MFWKSHHPISRSWSTQYGSVVFYHEKGQRQAAVELMREFEDAGAKIETEIVAFDTFHLAEDYHQKYYMRNDATLWNEVEAMYPDSNKLIGSTAVARINGYMAGHGSHADVEADLAKLGLSSEAQARLVALHNR